MTTYTHVLSAIKRQSDDQDTATAAVLEVVGGPIISSTNTLPSGVAKHHDRTCRPNKYDWIEHAERNAIYKAARFGYKTAGATMYMEWFPCADCARAIVQAGIKTLHCGPVPSEDGRYAFSVAFAILTEGGVTLVERAP